MPDYVPIQNLTIRSELEDTDYLPASDGSTAFAVHPPTFIANIIDDTLTESGKAADAKVTGDEIAELNTALKADVDYLANGTGAFADDLSNIEYESGETDTTGHVGTSLHGFVVSKYSTPIILKPGYTIDVLTLGWNTDVCIIGEMQEGSYDWIPLAISEQSSPAKQYSYTNETSSEKKVRICIYHEGSYVRVYKPDSEVDKWISDIESDLSRTEFQVDTTTRNILETGKMWAYDATLGRIKTISYGTGKRLDLISCADGDIFKIAFAQKIGDVLGIYVLDENLALVDSVSDSAFSGYLKISGQNAKWLAVNGTTTNGYNLQAKLITKSEDEKRYTSLFSDTTLGTFWTTTGKVGSNASYTYLHAMDRVLAEKGDTFYLKVSSMSGVRCYLITDEDGNAIEGAYADNSYSGFLTITQDDAKYLCVVQNANHDFELTFIPPIIKDSIASASIKWSIPDKVYAIKGVKKQIYLNNIISANFKSEYYSLEAESTIGSYNNNLMYTFTPTQTGTFTVTFKVYDQNVNLVASKTVTVEVIDNVLSSAANIMCIGDSITEKYNMPWYAKDKLSNVLTSGSVQPNFVGTKGGTSGMGNKNCYHEAYYGRDYKYLAGSVSGSPGPFYYTDENKLDIARYRSDHNITNKIDVVSLAMGWNGTNAESKIYMQQLIDAFLDDNPDTIFVIQMLTYPCMAPGDFIYAEHMIHNQEWREWCLTHYANTANIIFGDMGNCYDAVYGYEVAEVLRSDYYTAKMLYASDETHPSDDGTKELGENLACSLLKALQMATAN